MKPLALIIDDDSAIRDALADRLDSLGHDFHPVGSQSDARERLKRCTYDYILLDLEVPTRIGRPPSIQFGKNILCEIREDPRHLGTPVIVVTAHGHDSPELAVELMKLGATDFVNKPFHDLDEKIREALGRRQVAHKQPNGDPLVPKDPESLDGAEITVFEDRAELAGIEICNAGNGVIWLILKTLIQSRPEGRPRGIPGQKIADELNLERGQNGVADAISHFRLRTVETMTEAGFLADRETVIVTGKAGYQLNQALVIRNRGNDCKHLASGGEALNGEERQEWILAQITQGKKLRRVDIERHFRKSTATVKRDLLALGDQIEFIGSGPTGYYVIRNVPARKL